MSVNDDGDDGALHYLRQHRLDEILAVRRPEQLKPGIASAGPLAHGAIASGLAPPPVHALHKHPH
jgi:hypothetical protein